MRAEVFRLWWKLFMQRWDRAEQKELTAFYWTELRDMPDELFEEAARKALRSSVYFPTIEELEVSVGAGGLSPVEAWELVLPCLYGRASATSLPLPVRRVVAAMGGLSAMGARENELSFRRQEFMRLYVETRDHEQLAIEGG